MRASAARYAKALFDVATKETSPERAEQELSAFVELVKQHTDLQKVLNNPALPAARKRAVIQQLIAHSGPPSPVSKLLLLLAERGRLALLPDLLDVYRERLMEHQRVVRAEVTTAQPLSPERASQLEQQLASMTGRRVTMSTKVDPAIIGGMVARIGSTVYDGSVATQLARFRSRLEER